jgi:serine/threonine protein kinase
VCLLTYLLSHKMPQDFRAPPVLGYLRFQDDVGDTSFGLVLGSPLGASMGVDVCTLNDLLRSTPKASLSRRMTLCALLAESVYNFHSVNWLHKGIRSDSVLFFSESGKPADIRAPYLSGFDLSRPNLGTDMSEKPAKNPGRDMYRHPETQSLRSSGGYTKAFDIYSLGVVFIEIAFWKPIEKILGFDDPMTLDSLALSSIREKLLEGDLAQDVSQKMAGPVAGTPTEPVRTTKVLGGIASEGGDAYEEVVELCLRADEIEKPLTPSEPSQRAATRLQRVMEISVVAKLKQMDEALRIN